MASSLHVDLGAEEFCLNVDIILIKIFGVMYMAKSFIVSTRLATLRIVRYLCNQAWNGYCGPSSLANFRFLSSVSKKGEIFIDC